MTHTLPETTLFHEDDDGRTFVTGTSVTFDQVLEAYEKTENRLFKLTEAKVFAHNHRLPYGQAVALFRYIRDAKGDTFSHEQFDTFDDTEIDDKTGGDYQMSEPPGAAEHFGGHFT